jgi:hypothetical protein
MSSDKLKAILAKIQKQEPQKKKYAKESEDERFWKPTRDKTNVAYAVIRFLPNKDQEELSYVKRLSHSYFNESNKKWIIENCPRTKPGTDYDDCPICQEAYVQYKDNGGKNIDGNASLSSKTKYVTNILVLEDPQSPQNVGKVFLFSYGAKIHEKFMAAMQPAFSDEEPFIPYDLDDGRDFKLKVTGNGRDTNYDKSTFVDTHSTVKKQDSIVAQLYDLSEFTDPKIFKSKEELQKRLDEVYFSKSNTDSAEERIARNDDMDDESFISQQVKSAPKAKSKPPLVEFEDVPDFPKASVEVSDDEEDYFATLAKSI